MKRVSFRAYTAAAVGMMALTMLISWASGCGKSDPTRSADVVSPKKKSDVNDSKKLTDVPTEDLFIGARRMIAQNRIDDALSRLQELKRRDLLNRSYMLDLGRLFYACGAMKDSAEVYDEILEIGLSAKPELWQRGLALYYAQRFEEAVEQFESHQTFNTQDVENSVWHLLCKSKLTSIDEARKTMINIEQDPRVPMKQVFDLFAGTGTPEQVLEAAGYEPENTTKESSVYHGLFYVGLYYEMTGDAESSNRWMIEALKRKPMIPSLMGYVADGHLRARKAYPAQSDEG